MTDSETRPTDELLARLGRALAPAYELDGELARGGMAIVYRARDVRLKRVVAVKLLPPELAFREDIRSRFLREAETAARLSHPNIVPIYTVGDGDGLVYFVMALVTGGSVGDRLARGACAAGDTRRIVREVADALDYAHRRGVVHRDIKPDNILLDADSERAMVTDFGIARAASDDGGNGARLTATGAVIGTPSYMSPEQCAGDAAIDGRSDLYSLGAVAYEMLTGQPPFSGGSAPAVMMRHVTEPPVLVRARNPSVPADLDVIVMKLLEKEPSRRFQNAQELMAALDGAPVAPAPAQQPAARADSVPRYVMDVQGIGGHGVPLLGAGGSPLTGRALRRQQRRARSLPERIRKFRGNLFTYAGTSAMLFGINWLSSGLGGHLWFLYPALGMALGALIEMGTLVSESGVSVKQLFIGPLPPPDAAGAGILLPAADVAAGTYGAVLRQAASDRQRIEELIGKLTDAERRMLPDLRASADALYGRVDALANALHQLGATDDAGQPRIAEIEDRIADLEGQAGSPERERKIALLRRQRDTLAELERSRARLLEQYESAGLLLQNLALDLLTVRSSGLDAALGGITSATQEARALSREIGYVLGAARDLRALEEEKK